MKAREASYAAVLAIAVAATGPAYAAANDARVYLACRIVSPSTGLRIIRRFEFDEVAQTLDGEPAEISPSSIKARIAGASDWTIDRNSGAVEVRWAKDSKYGRAGRIMSKGTCERGGQRKF